VKRKEIFFFHPHVSFTQVLVVKLKFWGVKKKSGVGKEIFKRKEVANQPMLLFESFGL
jgi:hypothetical protein